MSEPKPDPNDEGEAPGVSAEDRARVREALGDGLRKFYDSVLDEPIPVEWMNIVGGKPVEKK